MGHLRGLSLGERLEISPMLRHRHVKCAGAGRGVRSRGERNERMMMEMEKREVQRAMAGTGAGRGGLGHSRALPYMQCDDSARRERCTPSA